MRFAIVFGLGMLANAIMPFVTAQGIAWFFAIVVALILDLAEYGQKSRKP